MLQRQLQKDRCVGYPHMFFVDAHVYFLHIFPGSWLELCQK